MEKDLRCFTVHMFFKVEGANIYGGETGYVEIRLGYCHDTTALTDTSRYESHQEDMRNDLAKQLGVASSQVVPIDYTEYKENTDDDEWGEGE